MNENPTNPEENTTPATDSSVADTSTSDTTDTQESNVATPETTEPTVSPTVDSSTPAAEEANSETSEGTSNAASETPVEPASEAPAAEVPAEPTSDAPVENFPVSDSSESQPANDTTEPDVSTASGAPAPAPVVGPKGYKMKRFLKALTLVVVVVALIGGAFLLGKSHQKIVVQAPAPKPVNLPPQAVVLTACVPGRGKQYIIPKDIPNGPIYDVENSKVVAIEYNLNVDQLFTDSDSLSNAILSVTKVYPVDHFSIVPAAPLTSASLSSSSSSASTAASAAEQEAAEASNQLPSYIHMIMFMVPKNVANSITCGGSSSTSSTSTGTSSSATSSGDSTSTSTQTKTSTTTTSK